MDEPTPTEYVFEHGYEAGIRMAWTHLLHEALVHLGYSTSEGREQAWILEREAAIQALRLACAQFGDNDWPARLSLADILDKHLVRHLPGTDTTNTREG